MIVQVASSHFRCMWCSRQTFLSFFHSSKMLPATEGSEAANLKAIQRLPCVSQTHFCTSCSKRFFLGDSLRAPLLSYVFSRLTHSLTYGMNEMKNLTLYLSRYSFCRCTRDTTLFIEIYYDVERKSHSEQEWTLFSSSASKQPLDS